MLTVRLILPLLKLKNCWQTAPSSEGGGQLWQSRCWRWRKTLVALVNWESGPRSILPCFIVLWTVLECVRVSPNRSHALGKFCNLPKILHYLHCQDFRPVNYPILCPRWNYIRSPTVLVSQMHVFRRRNPLLRVEGLLKVLESTISTKFRTIVY